MGYNNDDFSNIFYILFTKNKELDTDLNNIETMECSSTIHYSKIE